MTATSPNYGWVHPNSGADPVSAAQNFAFVTDIDATLAQIAGNIMSLRVGKASITPTPNQTMQTPITFPAMPGDDFIGFVTPYTSVPGTAVLGVGVLDETATGFTIVSYRTTDTPYSINWIYCGFSVE
jgi:hypothetical protein